MNRQIKTHSERRPRADHPADQIEEWLALHRMRTFVRREPKLYDQHAGRLLELLIGMYRSPDRVSEEMERYARELESIGHSQPIAGDPYQIAADAIRKIAQQRQAPPWADVAVDLEDRPQLSRLAHVLWEHNQRLEPEWTVSFVNVLGRVWTDPEPSPISKIMPAASRLSNWMQNRNVRFTVSVDNRGRRFLCWTA